MKEFKIYLKHPNRHKRDQSVKRKGDALGQSYDVQVVVNCKTHRYLVY